MTAKLYDAESWQDARRPDPSPERLKFEAAVIRRNRIDEVLEAWMGERGGPDYEYVMARRTDARTAADAAYEHLAATIRRGA